MNIIKIIGVAIILNSGPLLASIDVVMQLREVLVTLSDEYQVIESRSPAAGYRVIIETTPQFKARLVPEGGERTQPYLVGLPEDEEAYKSECPFCPTVGIKIERIFKEFEENLAIISNRGQILVIPKEHHVHWFVTPLEVQLQLIQDAVSLRKDFPDSENQPIILHCGTLGNQTVFHVHVRTNIYP